MTGIHISKGQTYLQGDRVTSFSEAGNSTYLTATNRLDYTEARNKMLTIKPDYFKMPFVSFAGEYWWIDGMLVQIVTRRITPQYKKLDMETEMYQTRGVMAHNKDYYDTLKKVNNFDVLIYYRKNQPYKWFTIQDAKDRYIILGVVHSKATDFEKSHSFIEKLVESIKLTEE